MPNLILPDAIQEKFAEFGQQNDTSGWEIGWLTAWVFNHCTVVVDGKKKLINPQTEEPLMSKELYYAIAEATEVKSHHSVRTYHDTAKHVPPSVKGDYPLGMNHWKAIIPHVDGTVTDLRKMADICLSWSGGVPSVAYVRARLAGKDGAPAKWEGRLKRVTSTCKRLAQDEQAPAFVRRAAELFIRRSVHPPLP